MAADIVTPHPYPQFVEDYLKGYRVPPGMRISDPTWKEFFAIVVERYMYVSNHLAGVLNPWFPPPP